MVLTAILSCYRPLPSSGGGSREVVLTLERSVKSRCRLTLNAAKRQGRSLALRPPQGVPRFDVCGVISSRSLLYSMYLFLPPGSECAKVCHSAGGIRMIWDARHRHADNKDMWIVD